MVARRSGWFGLAALAVVIAPSFAEAAWLGYKNNTTAVVVIQASDVVVVNGQVKQLRPGKAHALYPGEVAWDPITAAGPRLISVYDPKQNNRLAYQDRVDCKQNDIFLSLQLIQPPPVRGQPQPATLALVPVVLPAQAPGIRPPGSMPPGTTPPSGNPPFIPPGSARPPTAPNNPPNTNPPSTNPPLIPPGSARPPAGPSGPSSPPPSNPKPPR